MTLSTVSSAEDDVIAREDVYNDLHEAWNWCYMVLATCWLLVGVPGNLLVIVSCIAFKEMHTIPMALTSNLALCDLTVCLTNFMSTWVIFLYDRAFFLRFPLLCEVAGYTCGMGCFCSVTSICFIAINRYISVCQNGVYSKVYNKLTVPLHLIAIWTIGIVILGPAVVGITGVRMQYDRRQIICSRTYHVETGYSPLQWWETVMVIPLSAVIMIFTYSKIFSHVRESSKKLQKYKGQTPENGASQEKCTFSDRDLQLMRTLVIMFGVYIVCNLPWFAVVTFDFDDTAHHSLYYLSVWTFHTGSTLNPLIYAANYPQFRKSFMLIIKKLSCGLLHRKTTSTITSQCNTHSLHPITK